MQRSVLIVSERGKVREALAESLRQRGHSVTLVATGDEALQVVRNVSVGAVILEAGPADPHPPRLRARILKERPGTRVFSVSSFGQARSRTDLLRFGDEDFVVGTDELLDLIHGGEEEGEHGTTLASKSTFALIQVIEVLVALLEVDDRYFGGSSQQAMRLARAVAEKLGVEEEVMCEVLLGTLLRDIGKAGVDLEVLMDDGDYSEEQLDQMQEHVSGSVRLLEHIDFPWKLLPVIRHHHERYDGTGYPDRLRGREIPIGARIVAVVDAYVAMISDRAHRTAFDPPEALEEIQRQAGAQFDPEVVETLLKVVEGNLARTGAGGKPVVLIAEPAGDFRKLIKMRLVNEGFRVQCVASIGRARRKVQQQAPDIVLASITDESQEALQLLQEVREDEALYRLPFALLADTEDRILKVRALRQGADDYLRKDGDLEELIARVGNIIDREMSRRRGGAARNRGIIGRVENWALPDIVQTLAIGMKTACVTITGESAKGKIWFRDGKICHAKVGDREGETAFFEMVRWNEGEFAIQHRVRTNRSTIDSDPMFLVLEGMRRIDHDAMGEAG